MAFKISANQALISFSIYQNFGLINALLNKLIA